MRTVILFLIFLSLLSADIIPPGTQPHHICNRITNTADFPDTVFILYPVDMSGGYAVVDSQDCLSFYKFAEPHLYAMSRTAYEHHGFNLTEADLVGGPFETVRYTPLGGEEVRNYKIVRESDDFSLVEVQPLCLSVLLFLLPFLGLIR